jgi:signal peptidase I
MPVAEELDAAVEVEQGQPLILGNEASKPDATAAALVKAWLKTAAATVALFFFLVTFVVQGFRVYGSCMEPNLRTGERVLGNKLVYKFTHPARGDVVVFRCPTDPNKTYIKRVIGLPGETIEIRDGAVYINNAPLREPYLVNAPHGDYGPERITPGNLFVMGDFRDQSNDSRYWGELPINNVEAKAWVRYWPIQRLNMLK